MTAPMLMTDCPTEEILAAFVDDRLDAATRQTVTEHLASCGECRELVMMAADYQASETPDNVVRGAFGRRGWIAVAAGLAAAVVLVIVLRPRGPDMEDVATAMQGLNYGPSAGRFSGEFPYKKEYPRKRGDPDSELSGQEDVLAIALDAKDPHVRSVALLFGTMEREYHNEAVADLDEALKTARGEKRDALSIDLAAALLSRWADEKDHRRALELSEELFKRKQSPKVAWNRAAALEALGEYDKAIKAWDDYLNLDRGSEWAREAAKRQKGLVELVNVDSTLPSPKR